MEINERIKARRTELGLTLKDVADALNVAESTVSRYESSNIQNMGIDKIKVLADALKCTPAYLMGWEDPENVEKMFNKKTGELLDTIQKSPRLLQLNRDFIQLSGSHQQSVLNLVHSLLPNELP